jgi:hypothetical protein
MIRMILIFFFFSFAASAEDLSEKLIYETTFGKPEQVRILLEQGADANTKNLKGLPLLFVAMERNDEQSVGIMEELLIAGADVNIRDDQQNTPIMRAIELKNPNIVKLLIMYDADIFLYNANDFSVRYLGQLSKNEEIQNMVEGQALEFERYLNEIRNNKRMHQALQNLAFYACARQYFDYAVSSNTADENFKKFLKNNYRKQVEHLQKTAQRLAGVFMMDAKTIKNISSFSQQKIFSELQKMISVRFRRENGVGTMADLKSRCGKIANSWKIINNKIEYRE